MGFSKLPFPFPDNYEEMKDLKPGGARISSNCRVFKGKQVGAPGVWLGLMVCFLKGHTPAPEWPWLQASAGRGTGLPGTCLEVGGPGPTTYWLCDLGQVASLLWACFLAPIVGTGVVMLLRSASLLLGLREAGCAWELLAS